MITKINGCGLQGIDGYIVGVETNVSGGFPSWEIVGLPDAPVRESKERIRSALSGSGYILSLIHIYAATSGAGGCPEQKVGDKRGAA